MKIITKKYVEAHNTLLRSHMEVGGETMDASADLVAKIEDYISKHGESEELIEILSLSKKLKMKVLVEGLQIMGLAIF